MWEIPCLFPKKLSEHRFQSRQSLKRASQMLPLRCQLLELQSEISIKNKYETVNLIVEGLNIFCDYEKP